MPEAPILLSGPVVRVILDGQMTQIRRPVESARVFATPEQRAWTLRGDDLSLALRNASGWRWLGEDSWSWEADAYSWQAPATRTHWLAHIGYAPGDRLWVREAWACLGADPHPEDGVIYRAGHAEDRAKGPRVDVRWRPSSHMPRWASRLTLIVTDVRMELDHTNGPGGADRWVSVYEIRPIRDNIDAVLAGCKERGGADA